MLLACLRFQTESVSLLPVVDGAPIVPGLPEGQAHLSEPSGKPLVEAGPFLPFSGGFEEFQPTTHCSPIQSKIPRSSGRRGKA